MKASYLLEAKYICVHAKKGKYECEAETSYGAAKKAAEHWGLKSTAGIDAHLADKPKTATEGIEGMTPNTQVRGIMPKQRKPYHKHKIKSDYEPETDLNEDAKATMPFMDVIKQHYVEDMDGNTPADMDEARLYLDGRKLVDDVRDMLEGETGAEIIALSEDAMGGHPKALLMKVVEQMQEDAAMGDYTAIDELLKDIPQERLEGFLSEVESVQEKEDDEYDPRRVKADVMKHLVDMYNDAKKDGGYSSEQMHFALGNLLHDMDMAGYMNSDYFDIEGFFHKGIAKKQDYKVNMDMLRRAYKQAKNLDTDTSVDPAIFKRGGSAMKSHATESKSMLGEVTKELTEEEFDEAAGEKDACYRKVKSRYKVWPSAYASGALVQCRKVGAANWGNKKKK